VQVNFGRPTDYSVNSVVGSDVGLLKALRAIARWNWNYNERARLRLNLWQTLRQSITPTSIHLSRWPLLLLLLLLLSDYGDAVIVRV